MAILANLGVKLSLNSAEFKSGLDDATKNLQKFEANQRKSIKNAQAASAELGSTLGKVAAGVAAFGYGLMKVFEKSDQIADMAAAFDASIGSIVGMGKAMDMAGGKSANLGNLLSKLSTQAENAREGNDKLRDSFRAVGITAGEVENLNPDELFERVAQQLAKIEDPVKRNAKAVEILGKAAKGIDWKKYVEEYKRVADPDLAAAIKESADAFDNIQKAIGSLYYFVVKLIQPFASLINQLTTIGDRYREFKQEGGFINFDPDNPMAEGIEYKGQGKSAAPQAAPKSAKLASDTYKMSSEKEKAEEERLKRKAEQEAEQHAKLLERQAAERASIQESFRIKVEELSMVSKQIARETELIGLGERESELKKMNWAVEDNNLKMQLDLERQISIEKAKSIEMDVEKIAMLERQQIAYAALADLSKAINEQELNDKENKIRTQQILTDTERAGFEQAQNDLQVLGQQNKAGFAAFKAMQIAMAVIDTYSATQKAYQRGLEIPYVGMVMGPLFAGISLAAGMARVNMIRGQQYQGRAAGGSITANTPYMVGERGPELVIPHRGGTVIPNNQLSGVMGGGGVTYNGPYIANLSAIDTQSAAQFLAANKQAVWAANMTAQRSIPSSR